MKSLHVAAGGRRNDAALTESESERHGLLHSNGGEHSIQPSVSATLQFRE